MSKRHAMNNFSAQVNGFYAHDNKELPLRWHTSKEEARMGDKSKGYVLEAKTIPFAP